MPKPWIYGMCTALPLSAKDVSLPMSEMRNGYIIKIFQMLVSHLNLSAHGTNITRDPEFYSLAWLRGAEGPLTLLPSGERQEGSMRMQVWDNRSVSLLYKAREELEK